MSRRNRRKVRRYTVPAEAVPVLVMELIWLRANAVCVLERKDIDASEFV